MSAAPSIMAASMTWPRPDRLASQRRAGDAECEQHAAAGEVAEHVDRRGGRLAGPAQRLERAGERDVVDVVAGHRRPRSLLPPAGEPAVDQARVAGQADVGPDAEPLGDAGAPHVDQSVGAFDEPEHELRTRGVLQVDGDRALAPVQRVARRRRRAWPCGPRRAGRCAARSRRGRRAACRRTARGRGRRTPAPASRRAGRRRSRRRPRPATRRGPPVVGLAARRAHDLVDDVQLPAGPCTRRWRRGSGPGGRPGRGWRRRATRRWPRPVWPHRSSGTPTTVASQTAGMRLDGGLDLLGVDLLAARVDRHRAPAEQGDGAVVLEQGEVAGHRVARRRWRSTNVSAVLTGSL